MAFGLKVNGEFLDLYPNSTISFIKNSELWVTGDPTINDGSYSFPLDVPLTETNKRILRWPHRIDSYEPLQKFHESVLYVGEGMSIGLPLFTGDCYVESSGPFRAKVFLTSASLNTKKDLKFSDVNIGEYRIPSPLPLENLMTLTCQNPLDYDFIFFPVRNDSLTIDQKVDIWNVGGHYQNAYNAQTASWNFAFTGAGLGIENNNILTPFLRLEVLIDKVVTALGYTLINEWILTEEERLICVYNNKSISSVENLYYDIIRYNEHVPRDMKLTEFLIKISKWYFIGLFVDDAAKTITLLPYSQVIKADARYNWSDRAIVDYTLKNDTKMPRSIGYGVDSSDAYFTNNYSDDDATLEDGAVLADWYNRIVAPPSVPPTAGYYLSYIDRSIRYRDIANNISWNIVQHIFKSISTNGAGEEYTSEVIPLFDFYDKDWFIATPRADIQPNMEMQIYDEDNNLVRQDLVSPLSSVRVMIYRGFRTINNDPYPYANSTAYDPTNEAETFDISLHYDGDKGIYNRMGRSWIEFMKFKKITTHKLDLKIQDILNFREYDKVRIANMNYFVKSMRINVTSSGLSLTDCELVSIPFN